MNSVFMVASKWIKLGWRPKCLTRCGCGHGTLVFPMEGGPMERNHLEKLMWDVLQKHGMDHKKLSVFKPEEAPLIAQQVCESLGLICESLHEEVILGWLQSTSQSEPFCKRLRGEHSQDPLLVGSHMQSKYNSIRSSSGSTGLTGTLTVDQRWTPLSARQRSKVEQSTAKKDHEESHKDRWSKELYKELLRVDAPILKGMEVCVNQERLHVAIAGKTRSSTLKRYIKAWRDWQSWKILTWGEEAYVHPGMFCEYLFSRFDEPCGATVPIFICKAVSWFEKTAGFGEASIVSTSRAVCQIRDYITEKLAADTPPVRRAPRYPAVAVESLESLVLDTERTVCLRIMAWVKLLKIWGALRFDDMQKIKPADLQLTGGRLTTTLRVTKTSGPGKRVQELPVCISEKAYVWDVSWIETGFRLLKQHANFERDYLLPKFMENWAGFQMKYATYQDVSSYACHLRKILPSYYDFNAIFPEELASFWTEHSERATMPTALAMLGVETSKRDLVGRWKPEASDTYIRSYNGLVAQLQGLYGKAMRKPDRFRLLDEIDVAESADAWLRNRKTEIVDAERAELVSQLMASMDSFAIHDEVEVPLGEQCDTEQTEVLEEPLDDGATDDRKTSRTKGFIVVTTGKNCKRLHKASGGCWMARERIFKQSVEFEERPADTEFTHVCRVCWPKEKQDEESSGETSSDTGSSSSSSDSSS